VLFFARVAVQTLSLRVEERILAVDEVVALGSLEGSDQVPFEDQAAIEAEGGGAEGGEDSNGVMAIQVIVTTAEEEAAAAEEEQRYVSHGLNMSFRSNMLGVEC